MDVAKNMLEITVLNNNQPPAKSIMNIKVIISVRVTASIQ